MRRGQEILELGPDEVHLWLAFHGERAEERRLAGCRDLLSSGERAKEQRFARECDRVQYLLTRALVRRTLSRYEPVDPKEWKFSSNAYGRPEISIHHGVEARLRFNVSHTQGLIALGITRSAPIGVDAEDALAREAPVNVARRFFAPEEAATLAAAPEQERQCRFFRYWTLKEAYVKARGRGLSLPLDKFSFSYPDERTVVFSASSELESDPARWQFWQLHQAQRWLVGVCVRRTMARPLILSVRMAETHGGA